MSKAASLLVQLVRVLVPQTTDLLVVEDEEDSASVWIDCGVSIVVKVAVTCSSDNNDWFALSLYAESRTVPGLTFSVKVKASDLSVTLDINEVDGNNINLVFPDVSDIPWSEVGSIIGKAISKM